MINEKKKRMKGWINAQGGEKEEKTSVSVEALTQDNNTSSWQTETPRQRVLNVTRPPFHHRGSIQFFYYNKNRNPAIEHCSLTSKRQLTTFTPLCFQVVSLLLPNVSKTDASFSVFLRAAATNRVRVESNLAVIKTYILSHKKFCRRL